MGRKRDVKRAGPPKDNPRGLAPYRVWGRIEDSESIRQMENACALPVAVQGALMPDAHVGYGLPIGGVLAAENAVIPYAVGMDIACRMCLTVTDWPVSTLADRSDTLKSALTRETRFGVGAEYTDRLQHDVMDDGAWQGTRFLAGLKDRAWAQLGTSGAGNHFVEFGVLTLETDDLGLEAGCYLALLSHSGSRGTGAEIAQHYSRLAARLRPELPRDRAALAWLTLDSEEGQDYWRAMELMGRYAAANHQLIHERVVRHLGTQSLLNLQNHHNFAWRERHGGRDLVIHRKGATPAGDGALGIIPGSMATPGYIVRGLGNEASLCSAAHGAGRRMSRAAARKKYTWQEGRQVLARSGVTLLSAGLDEVPMAYKDIEMVMAAQADLVAKVARFDPKLVKMSPGR